MISQRYKTLFYRASVGIAMITMLVSCFGEPEFPEEPEIEFVWIENYNIVSDKVDSLYVAIKFRDGNGDLGLDPMENTGPYAPYEEDKLPEDTVINKYHFNYFVEVMKKEEDGVYRVVEFDSLSGQNFNGRFPILNNSGRDRPLEGELRYGFTIFYDGFSIDSPVSKGDSIKINIHIADRALNESNDITTAGVEIGSPKSREDDQEQVPPVGGD